MPAARTAVQLVCLALQLVSEVSMFPHPPDSNQNCQRNEYLNEDVMICCSKCQPGNRLKEKCTKTTNTVCEPCHNGTYSENMTSTNCFRCLTCDRGDGLIAAQVCTATSNARCECQEGWYCSYRQSGSCKTCSRQLKCPPGQGVSKKGTKDSKVKCEFCKEGTFSDLSSSTQTCQNHINCSSQGMKTLTHGNTTSDAKCISLPQSHLGTSASPTSSATISTSASPMSSGTISTSANKIQKVNKLSDMRYEVWIPIGMGIVLFIAIIVMLLCRKKGEGYNADADINKKFLPEDRDTRDPSTSSTSSQAESSHGVCVGPAGTINHDTLPTENPQVNFSFTTTINYRVCSSIQKYSPVATGGVPTIIKSDSNPPSSQEEVPLSCQCEEGNEVHVAVQESGKDIC